MATKEVGQEYGVEKVLEALLALPSKNLEQRVKELEQEIANRTTLSVSRQSAVGSRLASLSELLFRQRYITESRWHQETSRMLLSLESERHREQVECFRDVSRLHESLRTAREALARSHLKERLLTTE